jgi:hypothetical protein
MNNNNYHRKRESKPCGVEGVDLSDSIGGVTKDSVREGIVVILRIDEACIVLTCNRRCREEDLPLLWMLNFKFSVSI